MAGRDWSDYDNKPEDTCHCRCGEIYQSHTVYDEKLRDTVSRRPCPHCGSDCRITDVTIGEPPNLHLKGII